MPAAHAPLPADALAGTVSFQPGTTTLSPLLKQTAVTGSLPTLKLGSTSHESMRGSSVLDPADTLSPARRRKLKTPRLEDADNSTAVVVPEQQQQPRAPPPPASLASTGTSGPPLISTGEASSSEDSEDSEVSDGDDMAGLARLAAMRGGPKTPKKTRTSPAVKQRQSGAAVEKKLEMSAHQACDVPTAAPDSEGWEPVVKAKPKRDQSPKKADDSVAASAPAAAPVLAADDDDEDDWGCFYSGAKDASHRAKGKHGNNARQARCRQYAIDARMSQRQAS